MTIEQFASRIVLTEKTEAEKAAYIAYFFLQTKSQRDISINEISDWFRHFHFGQPNSSRLEKKLKKDGFVVGENSKLLRLHATRIAQLGKEINWLNNLSEEIIATSSILPETVYLGTRGYIESLAKQINASYDHNLFDGCAVLMRRLLEILLIHSFQQTNQEAIIRDNSGQFSDLSTIIKHAIPNKRLGLSKGTRDCMDKFRTLGNFSAHRIEYNCRRPDIEKVSLEYRACVEELLYKAGLK